MDLQGSDTYTPDQLISGDYPIASDQETMLSGETNVRGAVMGRVTASGKWILSLSAAVDGSEVPAGVLAQDVDASGGDVVGSIYKSGQFDPNFMTIGAAHTAATINAAWDNSPLFVKAAT